jgi:hypothetical protein
VTRLFPGSGKKGLHSMETLLRESPEKPPGLYPLYGESLPSLARMGGTVCRSSASPILEQVYAEIADLIDDFEGGGQLRMTA